MSNDDCTKELIKILSNEKSIKKLLPFNSEIIEQVSARIKQKEEQIEIVKKNISEKSQNLTTSLNSSYNLDVQRRMINASELDLLRWKFLVKSYYITRFNKIKVMLSNLIIPSTDKLCDVETQFCEKLAQAMDNATPFETLQFQNEDDNDNEYVFFKALENIGIASLGADETLEGVDIRKGQIYFSKFEYVREFYESGSIILI